jgi:hypothetical protein
MVFGIVAAFWHKTYLGVLFGPIFMSWPFILLQYLLLWLWVYKYDVISNQTPEEKEKQKA